MQRLSPLGAPKELKAFAAQHGGCILRSHALAAGLSPRGIARRLAKGVWRRHMGCLVLSPATVQARAQHELDAHAIGLRCGPGRVIVSGSTALALAGFPPPRHLAPVLIARANGHGRRPLHGITVLTHSSTDLTPRRLGAQTHFHGPTQAALDILSILKPGDARPWLEWALHQRILSAADIRHARGQRTTPPRRSTKGCRAGSRLNLALKVIESGTRSEAEDKLRVILKRNRIRGFQADWPISLRPGEPPVARLDFAHPVAMVAIEVDGHAFHSSRDAFEHDRTRQNLVVQAGWTVLRFTWAMLVKQESQVVSTIRQTLSAAACETGPSEDPLSHATASAKRPTLLNQTATRPARETQRPPARRPRA